MHLLFDTLHLNNIVIVFSFPPVINRDSLLRIAKHFEKKEKNSMRKSRPLKSLEVERVTSRTDHNNRKLTAILLMCRFLFPTLLGKGKENSLYDCYRT